MICKECKGARGRHYGLCKTQEGQSVRDERCLTCGYYACLCLDEARVRARVGKRIENLSKHEMCVLTKVLSERLRVIK